MQIRVRSIAILLIAAVLVVLIVVLTVQRANDSATVTTPETASMPDAERTEAERILRMRINSLSPAPAALGTRFTVESIEWEGTSTALVRYTDGQSTFRARATIERGSGRMTVERFDIVD